MTAHLSQVILEASFFALGAGLIYGIFGGGSGLFLMPGFYFLLRHFHIDEHYQIQIAIATTTTCTVLLGIWPTLLQARHNHIDIKVFKGAFPGLFIGTALAVLLLNFIPSNLIKHLFGVVVITVAIWFWCYRQEKDKKVWRLSKSQNFFATLFIGWIWYLLGVAVFTVPFLHKCGLNMRRSVGTGTLISTTFSLVAAILFMISGYFTLGVNLHHIGFVNTTLLAFAVLPSIIGGVLGVKISMVLPHQHLKKIFAVLVFIIGSLMLL